MVLTREILVLRLTLLLLLLGVTLVTSDRLRIFALFSAYWTILLEGSIAIAYLFNTWLTKFRDYLLILFIVTTYFLLPVLGFAYILIIMGLSQCGQSSKGKVTIYISLFFLLQLGRLFELG